MNDIECGRCADMKACADHPEQILGSRWETGSGRVVRVVTAFSGSAGRWCVRYETSGAWSTARLARFDLWVRLNVHTARAGADLIERLKELLAECERLQAVAEADQLADVLAGRCGQNRGRRED